MAPRKRHRSIGWALATAVVAAFAATPASGQVVPGLSNVVSGLPRLWLGVGPTTTTGGQVDTGIGLFVQGTFQQRRHHLALRGLWATEAAGSEGVEGGGMLELGLLYGRARIGGWTHTALSTGVAFVRLERCSDGAGSCNALGIPVAAEAAFQTFSAGLGVQLFANLNLESPYAGLAAFLQFGWMP